MSLLRDIRFEHSSRLVIWERTEDNGFFLNDLSLTRHETDFLETLIPKRQKEWLASRYLIQNLLGFKEKPKVKKDKFGKPYVVNSHQHISISHSHDLACVMTSDVSIGIDVQLSLDKISRIAHKFINDDEWRFIPNDNVLPYYHIIWGAKECIYKSYGRKKVDFKEHIHITEFRYINCGFVFTGKLTLGKHRYYEIRAEKFNDYFLVYAIEIDRNHFNAFSGIL